MDEMKNYCDGVEWFHYIPCHSWRLAFYVALQVAPEAHCITELGALGCTANSYRPVGNPQKCCAKNNGKRYKGKNLFLQFANLAIYFLMGSFDTMVFKCIDRLR